MKILLLHDYGTTRGGAEIHAARLRDALRQRGHEARLLTSTALPAELADVTCFGTVSRWRTLLQTANPWARAALARELERFRPDVVHVRMFLTQLSPSILPLLRAVPSVYHAVWYRAICPLGTKLLPDGRVCRRPAGTVCVRSGCVPLRDGPALWAQAALWRRGRSAFDRVVANSFALGERLVREGVGPVEVIWNGVPETAARPPLSGPPLAAFAGRLVREKGVDVLLDAFARVRARVPAARLVIAGEGPEGVGLRALADRLGLAGAVAFWGHVAPDELERRLGAAWVQVVPSRWEEPFGNAAAEAMMRGTAVVASGAGGLSEIVRDGRTGRLVPPEDPAGLAGALEALLADRSAAEELGAAARRFARAELTLDRSVARFLALYAEMGAGAPAARAVPPAGASRVP